MRLVANRTVADVLRWTPALLSLVGAVGVLGLEACNGAGADTAVVPAGARPQSAQAAASAASAPAPSIYSIVPAGARL